MKLTIDASPMLLNRTAMYYICRDVLATFEPENVRAQYFGQTVRGPVSASAAEALKQNLGHLLGHADNLANYVRPASTESRTGPVLFLDPLYVLFSDLQPEDFVLLLDLSTVTMPDWHNPAVSKLYAEAFARIASIQPNLLAISQNTADTYFANYGYPTKGIDVVHLYTPEHLNAAIESAEPFNGVSPYFLFVGSLEARKNLKGAINAFHISGLNQAGYRLLIAGGHGHGAADILALVERTPGVVLCGYVSDTDLASLYKSATGFVYPSYLEGFGVPLAEALLYGVPAVASTTGACPEVGGPWVPYCDPDDAPAIAAEMIRIAAMTPRERKAWAKGARDWVNTQFNYPRFQAAIRRSILGKEGL